MSLTSIFTIILLTISALWFVTYREMVRQQTYFMNTIYKQARNYFELMADYMVVKISYDSLKEKCKDELLRTGEDIPQEEG